MAYGGANIPLNNESPAVRVLTESWRNRVSVRKSNPFIDTFYDIKIPDFPEECLPFAYDPRYQALPPEKKMKILAGAWIFYNEKTIIIENEIITPVCNYVFQGALPVSQNHQERIAMAQTLVDEEYHILMSLEVCDICRRHRNLFDLDFPEIAIITGMRAQFDKCQHDADKRLVHFAYAVVAEVTINAYLNIVSEALSIQDMNRHVVKLHKADECGHNIIFRDLAKKMIRSLDGQSKELLLFSLDVAIADFTRFDASSFRVILDYAGVPEAEVLLSDACAAYKGPDLARDYRSFVSMLQEAGVSPPPASLK